MIIDKPPSPEIVYSFIFPIHISLVSCINTHPSCTLLDSPVRRVSVSFKKWPRCFWVRPSNVPLACAVCVQRETCWWRWTWVYFFPVSWLFLTLHAGSFDGFLLSRLGTEANDDSDSGGDDWTYRYIFSASMLYLFNVNLTIFSLWWTYLIVACG